MEFLKSLNKEQREAAERSEGPLLIVAGAGTGKTTVIAKKIAYLIESGKAKPEEILAVTFMEKAAQEMEGRVDALLPFSYLDIDICTFHAFCEKILKEHGLDIGLSTDFKLLNQTDAWLLVRENLDKFNLDYYRPLGNPTKFIRALIKHFGRAKDEEVWPEDYLKYAAEAKLNKDVPLEGEALTQEIARLEETANAYHIYQKLLLENNCLDFGDLINYALRLFRTRPKILDFHRRKYKYILVDEFQDTNWSQYELIKLLAAPKNNLTVVADDDQCLPGDAVIDVRSGKKKIRDIRVGDEVLTAVGKGHLGVSKVAEIFKNTKQAEFLTIKTARGYKITATDNHKMFCYVPKKSNNKNYYVYLMYRQGLGWRIGITNDLAQRIKFERSADKIIGLRAYSGEEEARFYEMLWSLKYGIPTGCFMEREGTAIKGEWLKKLYAGLNVGAGAGRLAADLNIELEAHHYCLAGVKRGDKSRIKINVEMCHRRYRSKSHARSEKILMLNPSIMHAVSLETSDKNAVNKLKKRGFNLRRAKKGWLFKTVSQDIGKIGTLAIQLQKLTGGFVEYKFNAGRLNYQTLPALIMPAKNLLLGHYVPARIGKEIYYDKIVSIKRRRKIQTVYDLEIAKTHNFIANGIVVHNSIYKFRGASVSNVLEFKKDYPKSEEIVLTRNYRSPQNLLDLTYNFIQLNNPNRLEYRLNRRGRKGQGAKSPLKSPINKRLVADTPKAAIIEHIAAETEREEAAAVAEKIMNLRKKEKGNWNDFAILVRANNQADIFLQELANRGVPCQFLASAGLYRKPIVMDILAYLRLLDDYHESSSLFRILNLPFFDFTNNEIADLTRTGKQKPWSLYEILKRKSRDAEADGVFRDKISRLLSLLEKHAAAAKEKGVSRAIYAFLEDSGYLRFLASGGNSSAGFGFGVKKSAEAISHLNQFYKKAESFERESPDKSLRAFMKKMDLIAESGDEGGLESDAEAGPEAVKIMTVHGAKGLEFNYVFIANLVDRRFPTIERREQIELPAALIKETIPEGDIHLEEERRLFYVACTRAKKGLFLASAEDYGGARKKKPSRFLFEIGLLKEKKEPASSARRRANPEKAGLKAPENEKSADNLPFAVPKEFSFSQLKAFETCPWQYRFAHILKIPVKGRASFSFGKSIHGALQKFFRQILEHSRKSQGGLFGENPANGETAVHSLDELLKFYEQSWIEDWYENKKEHDEYKKKGEKILKEFYAAGPSDWLSARFIEQDFKLKFVEPETGEIFPIKGVIDRIDELPDGTLEITDYKTGKPAKSEKDIDKNQLLLYQIAAEEILKKPAGKLSYYYLENNSKISFKGTEKDAARLKNELASQIRQIKKGEFSPSPSSFTCGHCDFKTICEFREL